MVKSSERKRILKRIVKTYEGGEVLEWKGNHSDVDGKVGDSTQTLLEARSLPRITARAALNPKPGVREGQLVFNGFSNDITTRWQRTSSYGLKDLVRPAVWSRVLYITGLVLFLGLYLWFVLRLHFNIIEGSQTPGKDARR